MCHTRVAAGCVAGEVLFKAGDPSDEVYFIIEGSLTLLLRFQAPPPPPLPPRFSPVLCYTRTHLGCRVSTLPRLERGGRDAAEALHHTQPCS